VGQVDQLAQDETTIYLLRAWKEIVALPKP